MHVIECVTTLNAALSSGDRHVSEYYMNEFERKCNIWGWLLFILCAAFFIASAWRSHDMLYLIGSVVFLVACLVFLAPFVRGRSGRRQ